jgi:hypothetical protein
MIYSSHHDQVTPWQAGQSRRTPGTGGRQRAVLADRPASPAGSQVCPAPGQAGGSLPAQPRRRRPRMVTPCHQAGARQAGLRSPAAHRLSLARDRGGRRPRRRAPARTRPPAAARAGNSRFRRPAAAPSWRRARSRPGKPPAAPGRRSPGAGRPAGHRPRLRPGPGCDLVHGTSSGPPDRLPPAPRAPFPRRAVITSAARSGGPAGHRPALPGRAASQRLTSRPQGMPGLRSGARTRRA